SVSDRLGGDFFGFGCVDWNEFRCRLQGSLGSPEKDIPKHTGDEEVIPRMGLMVNHVHALEQSERSRERRTFVKEDVELMVEDHTAVEANRERGAVAPPAQPAEAGNEQYSDDRDDDQRKANELLLRIFGHLPGTGAVGIVYAMVFPLAVGIG